jgi:hypothetical protein
MARIGALVHPEWTTASPAAMAANDAIAASAAAPRLLNLQEMVAVLFGNPNASS